MPVTASRMQTYDHSIGDVHEPAQGIRPLEYNIINMRLGKLTLGSKRWWYALFDVLHMLDYDEVNRLCAGRRIPAFIARRVDGQHRAWVNSVKNNPNAKRIGKAPSHTSRCQQAINLLRTAPAHQLGFVTVVADFAGSESEAEAQAEASAKRLSSFIRRRFEDAVCVLFPEVDQKVASSVAPSLIPRAGWKVEFDENQRIFKVHFHGLIYVPGFSAADIEAAFRLDKNGKRNRFYSGSNQVRVISVEEAPGCYDGTPDVDGVAGYSTKYHYKPPVMSRMLAGFISWLVVTSSIISNPKAHVVVGIRKGIVIHPTLCDSCNQVEQDCECSLPLEGISLDEFYGNASDAPHSDCLTVTHGSSSGVVVYYSPGSKNIILNSLSLSACKCAKNGYEKKFHGRDPFERKHRKSMLQNILFPMGP